MRFNNVTNQIHGIDSDGCGRYKIGRNFLDHHNQRIEIELSTLEKTITTPEEVTQARGEVGSEAKTYLCIACIMREVQTTGQEIVQFSWNPRKK
jgi:hypothetical protein